MAIITRSEQKNSDCWDLSSLYKDDSSWEKGLEELKQAMVRVEAYKGRLGEGAATVAACFQTLNEIGLLDERLGYYAFLRMSEDAGDNIRQSINARYMQVAVQAQTLASFVQPELLALEQKTLDSYLNAPDLAEFRISLNKMLRFKTHTLSEAEERLMAMQEEANQTAQRSFAALTDVDMDFGVIQTPEGEVPLSQSSFQALQMHSHRAVRQKSWEQFYEHFDKHKNTLASLYTGAVQLDIYQSKARGYPSSIEAALFPDKVDLSVYTNLIQTVREFLPSLHEYYRLRAKQTGLAKLELWDTKVSLVSDVKTNYSYDQAVEAVVAAVEPLGAEYGKVIGDGLRGTWVDRYENKGKRSGAFSAGSFKGDPYILMNYKEAVLRDVFTLAHEGGHSMHSWYSARSNPFQHYKYTIFEAEVASTFNEKLLFHHLMATTTDKSTKTYLINKEVDDMIATIFRQTMFAEFELEAHKLGESGSGITLDGLRSAYRELLVSYFGDGVTIGEKADLECLRIPHFYRSFYVYKYATGLSAAMALSSRVLKGGNAERDAYLNFLRSGGSTYPIESLRVAGVDMSSPDPVRSALQQFGDMVKQLGELLK